MPCSASDCKGGEGDKLKVEIKRRFKKRKLFLSEHFFIYTNSQSHRATGAGHLQALPLLTQPVIAESCSSQGRGQKSQEVRSIQAKVLPEGFRHDKLKLFMKSHGERELDRRILSQCFISSVKPTCVRRAGTKLMCTIDNIILPSKSYFAAGSRLSVHIVLCSSVESEVCPGRRQAARLGSTIHPPCRQSPGGHRPTNRVPVSWETQWGDLIRYVHIPGILLLDASSFGCM